MTSWKRPRHREKKRAIRLPGGLRIWATWSPAYREPCPMERFLKRMYRPQKVASLVYRDSLFLALLSKQTPFRR